MQNIVSQQQWLALIDSAHVCIPGRISQLKVYVSVYASLQKQVEDLLVILHTLID